MAALKFAPLRLAFELLLARHGAIAALALLAGGFAAVLASSVLPPLSDSIRVEQRRIVWLGHRPPPPALHREPKQASPLHAFEAVLAQPEDRIRIVHDVWDSATPAGVHLDRAEYRGEAPGPGGFGRLRLRLPVRGSYPAIKHYVFALMARHPGLALERIDLSRDDPGQELVEAQLQFSLLMKGDDER
ncbi:hypothetical protein [Niveibacterium terrae]|uniref:hypothetical protein n=1 Tax=Niveibacterium terrae TaxID=3373598 RepID=UPI003A911CE2